MTPLARSKKALEADGWNVQIVERWNAFARIRQDLWGIADLLCIGPRQDGERELLAVQVTSRSNMAARRRKIAESELAPLIREAGVRIVVHGWEKQGRRWQCKTEGLS